MKVISLFLLMLLLVVPIASAQEPAEDNACNPGGSMEGKCISDWHWTCGWYLARYERGEYTVLEVPQDCAASLIIPYLPPVQVQELVDALITICRVIPTIIPIEHCFSNNQTGTADFGLDNIIDVWFVFVQSVCPPSHPLGLQPTTNFTSDGFTAEDLFQILKLNPLFCGAM